MTTRLLAKLVWETECPECGGKGLIGTDFICQLCKGKKRVWFRITYTHAYSYEEALKKLLAKQNFLYRFYKPEDRFFLVWEKRALTNPIDVTRAVDYRLHDWQAKEIYAKDAKRKTGALLTTPFYVVK